MRKTSVYLTDEESARLRALARSSGRSQAELIRQGIESVLSGPEGQRRFHSLGRGASGGGEPRRWDADELARRRLGRS